MAVTIAHIAKRVGVHPSTVSTVLNNSRSTVRISERTRQKILSVARALHYRPSFSARALAKGRTYSLGMVCGDIHSPHYSELASHAMHEAEARGYHLLLSVTRWITEEESLNCLETLMRRGVDGVVSWGSGLKPGSWLYDQVVRERFPIVCCAEAIPRLCSVDSDWRFGFDEAVAYLKRKGHGRICFVGFSFDAENVDKIRDPKRAAFFSACTRHGVEGRERYLRKLSDLEEAEELGMELARKGEGITAYLVYSDYVAFGFCRGLFNQGKRIPEDVAVVGVDGTKMGRYFHPSLTSIAQDRERLVVTALDMVVGMIDKKEELPRQVTLPTRLIIRESA